MAVFHLLREEYQEAKSHVTQAKEIFYKFDTSNSLTYCKIQKEFLNGCCLACEVPIDGIMSTLSQQLQTSIKDQYVVCIYYQWLGSYNVSVI